MFRNLTSAVRFWLILYYFYLSFVEGRLVRRLRGAVQLEQVVQVLCRLHGAALGRDGTRRVPALSDAVLVTFQVGCVPRELVLQLGQDAGDSLGAGAALRLVRKHDLLRVDALEDEVLGFLPVHGYARLAKVVENGLQTDNSQSVIEAMVS